MTRANEHWSIRDAKTLQEFEVRLLMRAARSTSPRAHALLAVCYNGAMRVCEALHLRVRDFDFKRGSVQIIPAQRARKETFYSGGKITSIEKPLPEPISYPLPTQALGAIQEWIKKENLQPHAWVFCGNSRGCSVIKFACPGGHMSKREAQRIYQAVASEAGLTKRGRGIHALKHSRLLECARKTMDPWFVKEAGRLASVVLSDIYVRHVKMQQTMAAVGGKV